MKPGDTITTGLLAELAEVAPATVFRAVQKGSIDTQTTPGGHHRIPVWEAIKYLRSVGMGNKAEFIEKLVKLRGKK